MPDKKVLIDDLVNYINKNLKKGYTKESLRWALIDQGYSRMDVDNAMKRVDRDLADKAPILKTKPEIEYKIVPLKEEPKKSFWKRLFG